jgi:copper chaperone CopZ
MKHTYAISGIPERSEGYERAGARDEAPAKLCGGCAAKVKGLLSGVDGVTDVVVDLGKGEAEVKMSGHVGTEVLKEALTGYPKYGLSEVAAAPAVAGDDEVVSWMVTYKPILLLFGYITIAALVGGNGKMGVVMRIFMSGFFLSFSFFKLLNLRAFAESYAMYDVVASRWGGWGYVYAFIELGLGLAFAVNVFPFYTNLVTLIVMSVSIVGVLQSVLNKRKIKCACLGAVFNLPMSTVTIIEDALMIGMSAVALVMGL